MASRFDKPCFNCTDRFPACQDKCQKKAEVDKAKEEYSKKKRDYYLKNYLDSYEYLSSRKKRMQNNKSVFSNINKR